MTDRETDIKVLRVGWHVLVRPSGASHYVPVNKATTELGSGGTEEYPTLVFEQGKPVSEQDIQEFVERWAGLTENHKAVGLSGSGELHPVELTAEEALSMLARNEESRYMKELGRSVSRPDRP